MQEWIERRAPLATRSRVRGHADARQHLFGRSVAVERSCGSGAIPERHEARRAVSRWRLADAGCRSGAASAAAWRRDPNRRAGRESGRDRGGWNRPRGAAGGGGADYWPTAPDDAPGARRVPRPGAAYAASRCGTGGSRHRPAALSFRALHCGQAGARGWGARTRLQVSGWRGRCRLRPPGTRAVRRLRHSRLARTGRSDPISAAYDCHSRCLFTAGPCLPCDELGIPGVALAGDWVGAEAMLADAAVASGLRAADMVQRQRLRAA